MGASTGNETDISSNGKLRVRVLTPTQQVSCDGLVLYKSSNVKT